MSTIALIIGAGSGLSASLARLFAAEGMTVALAARQIDKPDSLLDPDAIAQTYLSILCQPRSAWTWEVELRPWVEPF